MTALRILHIDDEPDIRDVVELSLGLDPAFTVRSCACGGDALATAADWIPDLILCDVMMPVMDGPATLARLRESPSTADIPVVFMTARAQTRELEHFKSLGANGVIAKPFDPMTLANLVRTHLRSARLAALRENFIHRLRADANALARYRATLARDDGSAAVMQQIKSFAHALIGAAGIFDYQKVSDAASALEQAVIEATADGSTDQVAYRLDALLACIECE